MAISLAIATAESGRRVYYGTLAGLIDSLEEARIAGNLNRRLRTLSHPALLIVDEIGYLPVTQSGATLFFQLVNRRYEHASTVLTSNKGFEEWGRILGDEVMAARRCSTGFCIAATSSTSAGTATACAATPTSPRPSIPVRPETSPASPPAPEVRSREPRSPPLPATLPPAAPATVGHLGCGTLSMAIDTLMNRDARGALLSPLRFMADQGREVLKTPLSLPGKALRLPGKALRFSGKTLRVAKAGTTVLRSSPGPVLDTATVEAVHVMNRVLARMGVDESVIARVLGRTLTLPVTRFQGLRRGISLPVIDRDGDGRGEIPWGTYQSPILLQWRAAPRPTRQLDVKLVRFV